MMRTEQLPLSRTESTPTQVEWPLYLSWSGSFQGEMGWRRGGGSEGGRRKRKKGREEEEEEGEEEGGGGRGGKRNRRRRRRRRKGGGGGGGGRGMRRRRRRGRKGKEEEEGGRQVRVKGELTVYGKKNFPCTVRFTPDRLSKTGSQTALKRILNGPQTGAERTVHGPFRFMYVAHTHMRIIYFFKIISVRIQILNSASHLPV